jgi:hypothetical protein
MLQASANVKKKQPSSQGKEAEWQSSEQKTSRRNLAADNHDS